MPRDGSGVFSLTQPARADGNTILASEYNSDRSEYIADANAARPVVAGGTGATGASAARTNLAVAGLADNNAFTGNCTHAGPGTFNRAEVDKLVTYLTSDPDENFSSQVASIHKKVHKNISLHPQKEFCFVTWLVPYYRCPRMAS